MNQNEFKTKLVNLHDRSYPYIELLEKDIEELRAYISHEDAAEKMGRDTLDKYHKVAHSLELKLMECYHGLRDISLALNWELQTRRATSKLAQVITEAQDDTDPLTALVQKLTVPQIKALMKRLETE